MFERMTDRARRILVLSQEEAHLMECSYIGVEHLLLGCIHEGEGVAAIALKNLGAGDLELARQRVETRLQIDPPDIKQADKPPEPWNGKSRPFTPRCKKVLELALREALQLGHNYIGTEHLLLAIVREGESVAVEMLTKDYEVDLSRVRHMVVQLLSGPYHDAAPEPIWIGVASNMVECKLCSALVRDAEKPRANHERFHDELEALAQTQGRTLAS